MKVKLSKSLTAVLTALVLISCFVALYNVGLASSTQNFEYYAVVFTETGLPQGTSWSVTFDGEQITGATSSITARGTGWHQYSYTIDAIGDYVSTPSSGTVTPTNSNPVPINVVFNYSPQITVYTLDISATTGGTTSPGPGSYNYNQDQPVEVTATPYPGYYFAGWLVDDNSLATDNPLTGRMWGNHAIQAVFEKNPYSLTIITSGQGTVSQGNITCGPGETVNLKATAAAGWSFAGWSGDATGTADATVRMDGNKTVAATFTQDSYKFTAVTVGQGTVSVGNQTVLSGTTISMTATPAEGWVFSGWSGDAQGTANATVTMNSNKAVTATFTPNTYTLTTITVGNGTVTPANQTYSYGQQATLTATPASGWTFSGWSGDAQGTTSTTILMNNDKTVTATFTKKPSPVQIVDGNITQVDCTELTGTRIPNRYDPEFYSDLAFNCTVTGPSGTSGHCRIAIPLSMLRDLGSGTVVQNIFLYIDNVRYNLNDRHDVTCDSTNYYLTFYIHFSTHDICVQFREPEPTPTSTPTPTATPAPTAAPTAEPTAIPTATPTVTPTPTVVPTVPPTTMPTITPAPTATTQPSASAQSTSNSSLTLPIAGAVILLVLVLVGLVVRNRKHKP